MVVNNTLLSENSTSMSMIDVLVAIQVVNLVTKRHKEMKWNEMKWDEKSVFNTNKIVPVEGSEVVRSLLFIVVPKRDQKMNTETN